MDTFANIETYFLTESVGRIKQEMMCDFAEIAATKDQGLVDQVFCVLLDIVNRYEEEKLKLLRKPITQSLKEILSDFVSVDVHLTI